MCLYTCHCLCVTAALMQTWGWESSQSCLSPSLPPTTVVRCTSLPLADCSMWMSLFSVFQSFAQRNVKQSVCWRWLWCQHDLIGSSTFIWIMKLSTESTLWSQMLKNRFFFPMAKRNAIARVDKPFCNTSYGTVSHPGLQRANPSSILLGP